MTGIPRKKAKKNKFTEKEDLNLIDLVSTYGDDWKTIANKMRNRNVRQCRERWRYYLDPSLKTFQWTKTDDELLLTEVKEYGKKWKIIAQFFPLQTYVAIKNRYATIKNKNTKKSSNENQEKSTISHSNQQQEPLPESTKLIEEFLSSSNTFFAEYFEPFD